ncbi:MAG: ATP-grasp domain-containing protein [Verrucomicrobiota bacterium]
MTTLLLPPRHTDDARLIWRAAIAAGWKTERLAGWSVPEVSTRDLAFYGEPLLAQHLTQTLKLRFIEPRLDWLVSLPQHYRQREIQFTTLAHARHLPGPAFFKPADDKAFTARVYPNGAAIDAKNVFEDELAVLVSGPVRFDLEYRCFVLHREIQTFSLYCRGPEVVEHAVEYDPAADPHSAAALALAQSLLADESIYLPPAVVLDVGLLSTGRWAVIECNPAWGSGIYGCDPTRILPVLKRACIPEEHIVAEDPRAFVIRKSTPRVTSEIVKDAP